MAGSQAALAVSGAMVAANGASIGALEAPDRLEHAIANAGSGAGRHHGPLGRAQKAAVIVRLLVSGDPALALDGLDAAQSVRLVRAMAGLSYVDEATILAIIGEFLDDFGSLDLYFKSGIEGALDILSGKIGDEVKTLLTAEVPVPVPDDPWQQVRALDALVLADLMAGQTPQVAGVILAKLPVTIAAEVLETLAPETANTVALATATAGNLGHETVAEIGAAIAASSGTMSPDSALPGAPSDRIGAILNFTPSRMREDLLTALERADPDVAEKVRRTMFTFGDIPDRVEVKDVPKIVRAVDNDTMVAALAAGTISDKGSVDFILGNLSKRLSEQLSEEVGEIGEVKQKDGDKAMNVVIQGIRDLEEAGEISLISPEE